MKRFLYGVTLLIGLAVGSAYPLSLLADQQNIANLRADNLAAGTKLGLGVMILDGAGNQVTSFGGTGGTAMTDDAAFSVGVGSVTPVAGIYRSTLDSVTDGDAGVFAMLANRIQMMHVVDATGTTVLNNQYALGSTTIGQNGALSLCAVLTAAPTYTTAQSNACTMDTSGAIRVNVSNGATGGTSAVDDADFVDGTTSFTLAGYVAESASPSTVTEGDMGAAAMTIHRAVKTVLVDADGEYLTTNQDLQEDETVASGIFGPAIMTRRILALSSTAGADAEYAMLNTNALGALYTQPTAGTTGGADGLKYTSTGSTEDEHAVKATAGTLYSVTATNTNAAVRYLRCANAVIGSTTPGSTTPIIDLAVPGATTGSGITFPFPVGFAFSTALTCWTVTGAADTDQTEVASNELKFLYTFK